jgi:hypothetical protein
MLYEPSTAATRAAERYGTGKRRAIERFANCGLHGQQGLIKPAVVHRPAGIYRLDGCGGVAEWSNAAVLKTVGLHGPGGSNPSPSATYFFNLLKYLNLLVTGSKLPHN